MSKHERGPAALQAAAGPLKTRMGACFPGSHAIFRGHDLHTELQDMGWVELHLFGVTGRRFPRAQCEALEALWKLTSYPDARIWNNRVAALAGSARSTGNLGVAAALAVSEASIYGRGIDIRAIDFFIRTQKAVEAGGSLVECVHAEKDRYGAIAGYGRPITSGDERIPHMLERLARLGLEQGPHLRLAFAVNDYLINSRWQKQINYGAVAAAVAADCGLSPREYYLYLFPAFLAGMPPCFIEAEERPEGALYALACSQVVYEGPAQRVWPGKSKKGHA